MSKLKTPEEELGLFIYAATLVEYNSENGEFTWKYREGDSKTSKSFNTYRGGKVLDSTTLGYLKTGITYKNKYSVVNLHRLAWFICKNEVPNGYITHINGDILDNRISNLKVESVLSISKSRTMSKRNKSGISGVYWYKRTNKWAARCGVNYKMIHLGYFDDINEAAKVVRDFRSANSFNELHGQEKNKETK